MSLATSLALGESPGEVYVEGYSCGVGTLTWSLVSPSGLTVHTDTLRFTVVDVGLTAYRPQTEAAGYGAPFARTAVPDDVEESQGAGIRRNGDDDNGNSTPDRQDTNVQDENDLIEVAITMQPSDTLPEGIRFVIERSTADVKLWGQSGKVNALLDNNSTRGLLSGGSAWAEWVTAGTGTGSCNLTLGVWDSTHNRRVYSDTIRFYPFTSVVIVLGGENQVPADPVNAPVKHGVFELALRLYRTGYDVHMYDEDAVDEQGADDPDVGRPNNEVVSARNDRGVTQVAIYGYSHGGGSTYLMVNRLWNQEQIRVDFTAYIDAVRDEAEAGMDARQETRRPPESAFHANYYQEGVTNPLSGFFDAGLDGGPIEDILAGDFQIDVETEPAGAPWQPNATHYTVDDLGNPALTDLEARLRARVQR